MKEQVQLPPCALLHEMFDSKSVQMPDGTRKPLTAAISMRYSAALYSIVRKLQPRLAVEIGMGQGVSSLSILTALQQTGGRLISIDPYEGWQSGMDAALCAIDRAGFSSLHCHIRQRSELALPRLWAEGTEIDFAYIDGSHCFDNAFIDWFYLDKMLRPEGVIGFNNAGWLPVWRVIRHLKKSGRYTEIPSGLRPDYSGRTMGHTILRWLLRIPRQDRYFRKS